MRIVKCPQCEKRYRVDDGKLGKALRCRQCGKVFRVAAPPPDADPLPVAPPPPPPVAPPPPPDPACTGHVGAGVVDEPEQRRPGSLRAYLRDVADTLAFSRSPGNVATFAIMAVIVALRDTLLPWAGCLGLAGIMIVSGWVAAFLLNTVVNAAAGDDELPSIATTGWWDDIVLPLVKYAVSWVAAWLPLVAGLAYLAAMESLGVDEALGQLGQAIGLNFDQIMNSDLAGAALVMALLVVSISFWPMTLLVVAVGGMPALVRLDLMVRTILRTLPAYCVVVLAVLAGLLVPGLIGGMVMPEDAQQQDASALLLLSLIMAPLSLYGKVFAMRAVGLYYHHFKARFAWSWG